MKVLKFACLFLFLFVICCVYIPNDLKSIKLKSNELSKNELSNLELPKKYLSIKNLGLQSITNNDIKYTIQSLGNIIENRNIIIASVANSSLGGNIKQDEWDKAFEEGLVEGLLYLNVKVIEKLDSIFIRNPQEYIDTDPPKVFYSFPFDIGSVTKYNKKYKSDLLLMYQLLEINKDSLYSSCHFKIVDLKDMKILFSQLVVESAVGGINKTSWERDYQIINQAIVSSTIPEKVTKRLDNAAIMNIDMLQLSKNYNPEQNKTMLSIENAVTSGIIKKAPNYYSHPFLVEKTTGFEIKFPSTYDNIVFYPNPLIYDSWGEFIKISKVKQLILYRYTPNEGIYLRFVDAENNGEILYSMIINFPNTVKKAFYVHDLIAGKISTLDSRFFDLLDKKNVMIIEGNSISVNADKYHKARDRYNEVNLALEDGIISALTNTNNYNIHVIDKLSTIYLKPEWMFKDEIFNLNPIYIDNWNQIKNMGADIIFVYNNLITYEPDKNVESINTIGSMISKQKNSSSVFESIALEFKIIDLITGQIIYSGQVSNL